MTDSDIYIDKEFMNSFSPRSMLSRYRSIGITPDVQIALQEIKTELSLQSGGRVSYSMLIKKLCDVYRQLENTQLQLEESRLQVLNRFETENQFLRDLLLHQANSIASLPTNMQVMMASPGYLGMTPSFPQIEQQKGLTDEQKKKLSEMLKASQEQMKDSVEELNAITKETQDIKPSTILECSEPDHKNGVIEDIEIYKARRGKEKIVRIKNGEKLKGLTPPPHPVITTPSNLQSQHTSTAVEEKSLSEPPSG